MICWWLLGNFLGPSTALHSYFQGLFHFETVLQALVKLIKGFARLP